jgi:DNA-binding NarL/FixJ family response regulator
MKVLVVEDEPLVALDIAAVLKDAGCTVIGPAGDLAAATKLIEENAFDVALLDANLNGQGVGELAQALGKSGVSFGFLTGYSREGLPIDFKQAPMVQKPFLPGQLLDLVGRLGPSDPSGVSHDRQPGSN